MKSGRNERIDEELDLQRFFIGAKVCYTRGMINDTHQQEPEAAGKMCRQCRTFKPLAEFPARSGRRAGRKRRRGTCRSCRQKARKLEAPTGGTVAETEADKPKRRRGPQPPAARAASDPIQAKPKPNRAKTDPRDPSGLRPTRQGFIRMLGKSDNGRRWYQEIEPDLAVTLVREGAAVVASRHTIRRLYSNKEFRRLILMRDNYTCRYCGQYGDTIDHLLPRAKGGHTTPANCVCACNECNQSKADRDLDEFMRAQD